MLTVSPGDSLRLLGTTILPVTAFSPELAGPGNLVGHLCVREVSRTFIESRSGRRVYSNRQQILWCANAAEKYEVNYEPKK